MHIFAHQLLNSVQKFEHLSDTTYTSTYAQPAKQKQKNTGSFKYSNRCSETANANSILQ